FFFVTLLSLLIHGPTGLKAALGLRLVNPQQQETDFGVELSDDVPTSLHTVVLNSRQLERGNTLRDLALPQGSLVMMIKRGDRRIVPNGTVKLRTGDALLIIQEEAQ
ncbi:MAG: potassium/proton antiporter, partial [Bacteroidales bacterium]|nr:potassium/proton antiporter [Bacteroidales bacterium]